MKKLSRQRAWQLRQKAEGNCEKCGKPSPEKSWCDSCANKYRPFKKRHPLKSAWEKVDFSRSVKDIALEFGVCKRAVLLQKKKRTKP
jgi:hypothetical protein